MRRYWKVLVVVLAVAIYFNVGYWMFQWMVASQNPTVTGHGLWYDYLDPKVSDSGSSVITEIEIFWPFVFALFGVVWLISKSAALFWALAFRGEFFRLLGAFFHRKDWPEIAALTTVLILFSLSLWRMRVATKETYKRSKDEGETKSSLTRHLRH